LLIGLKGQALPEKTFFCVMQESPAGCRIFVNYYFLVCEILEGLF